MTAEMTLTVKQVNRNAIIIEEQRTDCGDQVYLRDSPSEEIRGLQHPAPGLSDI